MSQNESYFAFDEVFFSRTDHRGVILAGNSVFQRVSHYSWDELLHKPHSLIRHQDMPRGVFHLFWQTILGGEPIGAYVKNKAKDGSYYWVFALALPLDDGFISVRLKPSADPFAIVKKEYASLLDFEKSGKKPQESHQKLLGDLKSLGFNSYRDFMIASLMLELQSRQKQLKLPPLAVLEVLKNLTLSSEKIQSIAKNIFALYKANSLIPMNLEIRTRRLGEKGASLAVVAKGYESMAGEIRTEIDRFLNVIDQTQKRIAETQFGICASILISDVFNFFQKEQLDTTEVDVALEISLLDKLKKQLHATAVSTLSNVDLQFTQFTKSCEDLRSAITGLDIVRLTGMVESSRLNEDLIEIQQLLHELAQFKTALSESIEQINFIGSEMQSMTHQMQSHLSKERTL